MHQVFARSQYIFTGFSTIACTWCCPRLEGKELVRLRWAEPHQHADFGTESMIYGPRDTAELAHILSVVAESLYVARTEA